MLRIISETAPLRKDNSVFRASSTTPRRRHLPHHRRARHRRRFNAHARQYAARRRVCQNAHKRGICGAAPHSDIMRQFQRPIRAARAARRDRKLPRLVGESSGERAEKGDLFFGILCCIFAQQITEGAFGSPFFGPLKGIYGKGDCFYGRPKRKNSRPKRDDCRADGVFRRTKGPDGSRMAVKDS